MTITTYFPIEGYEAVCCGPSVELRLGNDTLIWMTFFDSGIFTVREPGRGHAGRFPLRMSQAELRDRVAYALTSFRERRAA